MLDGVEVNIGDKVFVLGIGYGDVKSVSADGSFKVRIGRATQEYRNGGMIGNVRKVYWHDPLFVVPPKDPTLWATFKEQALYNYALMVRILQGDIKAPQNDQNEIKDESADE